jgi:TolB-like protein/Tfp pilus assembly protein PilF
MALPLPDKPSIAVLPFVNMSDDPKQEFFSDGITEDIITALSKTPRLFVIARNSTFVYKGKPVKIQQVAEDLGVRYVLEGSVRKSEDSVRVTAQLIDALKGTHLWADKYDRNLKDIFTIQDDITREIIAALQVELTEGEQARIWSRGTQNEKAYEAALESLEHFRRFNPDDVILCRKKAQEALALDPNYPFATALLAWSHLIEVWNGWTKSPGESLKKAAELGRKTIALDENYEGGHALLGSVYLVQKRWDEAIEKGQRAVELSPSGADANGIFGITLCHVGRPQESISLFKKAIRLNPSSPNWLYHNLGVAQIMAGNYQAATASLNRVIEKNPDHIPARFYKIVALSLSNQEEEARNQIEEYFNLRPNASIENWRKRITFRKETDIELFANALNKVGFPKTPPLPLPDKPSIAVLPFVNMSGDLDQEYFSDGITEEIITALSKTPKLFVIARNSTFTYKGKPVWIPTVGKELGVRYVLEGSVRRADNQVRVTAQLIDAKTNQHLWAERWDRDLEDIFSVQDEITHKIITAMQIKLTEGEQARLWGKNVRRLDVFLKLMEARSLAAEGTAESRIRFGQVAREVIDLAPESQVGYDLLAWHHWWLAMYGKSPPENLKKSFALAQKLLSMNEFSASAHSLLGSIYLLMREYEKAIAAGEKSIELQPNGAMAHLLLANTLSYVERPDEAIFHIKQGIRLNPFPTYHYFFNLARCYILKGRYEEALAEYKRAMELAPGNWPTLAGMTVVYSLLGRKNKAGEAAERLLEANPKYSVHLFTQTAPYKSQDRVTQFANALRKAGLK